MTLELALRQADQSRAHTPKHLLEGSGPLSPCPIHPKACARQQGDRPSVSEPADVIHTFPYLIHSSHRNRNKGSCPGFPPCSFCLLTQLVLSHVIPWSMVWPLLLGSVNLLALPYLNNKTFLKTIPPPPPCGSHHTE